MKGVNRLAMAIPFYFIGPALFYWKGGPGIQQGEWLWAGISITLMFLAVALTAWALWIILDAFFEK